MHVGTRERAMAQDKFMFFPNFKAMADKLDSESRLAFYDALTDYVFFDKEPSDPIISALVEAIKPSLNKIDGRRNNGGNHNPNGVNQHSKSGQSGQIRSKLVNSGQFLPETETEEETGTETKEKELSNDNSKNKVCEETVFNAGFQNWKFDPVLLKIAKKHWTADTIRKIETDFSCQEYNTYTTIQELLERYPADKDKAVLPKNLGQYEYMRPQMQKWIDYKKSRGEKYKTEQSLMVCAKKLHELSGGNALNADAIVEQSIASNYAGLFPLKQNASPNMPRMSLKEMKELQNEIEVQKILRGER